MRGGRPATSLSPHAGIILLLLLSIGAAGNDFGAYSEATYKSALAEDELQFATSSRVPSGMEERIIQLERVLVEVQQQNLRLDGAFGRAKSLDSRGCESA